MILLLAIVMLVAELTPVLSSTVSPRLRSGGAVRVAVTWPPRHLAISAGRGAQGSLRACSQTLVGVHSFGIVRCR